MSPLREALCIQALRKRCITLTVTCYVHARSYVRILESQPEAEGEREAMAPCDHNTSGSGGGPFKRRGLVFLFGYLAV